MPLQLGNLVHRAIGGSLFFCCVLIDVDGAFREVVGEAKVVEVRDCGVRSTGRVTDLVPGVNIRGGVLTCDGVQPGFLCVGVGARGVGHRRAAYDS